MAWSRSRAASSVLLSPLVRPTAGEARREAPANRGQPPADDAPYRCLIRQSLRGGVGNRGRWQIIHRYGGWSQVTAARELIRRPPFLPGGNSRGGWLGQHEVVAVNRFL